MQKPFSSSVDNPYGSKSYVPYRGQPRPRTILMDLNVQCLFGQVNTNRNEFRITANTNPLNSIFNIYNSIQHGKYFLVGTGKSDFRYITYQDSLLKIKRFDIPRIKPKYRNRIPSSAKAYIQYK